jgi:hypothetical protein
MQHFSKMQSVARKDVERAFEVLQARWDIMRNPVRAWDLDTITNIMIACIILHNMILQDEQGEDLEDIFDMPLREGTIHRTASRCPGGGDS